MKYNYTIWGVGIGLGYDYKIADKVFIEPMLKYVTNKPISTEYSNSVIQSNLILSIGIITKI